MGNTHLIMEAMTGMTPIEKQVYIESCYKGRPINRSIRVYVSHRAAVAAFQNRGGAYGIVRIADVSTRYNYIKYSAFEDGTKLPPLYPIMEAECYKLLEGIEGIEGGE